MTEPLAYGTGYFYVTSIKSLYFALDYKWVVTSLEPDVTLSAMLTKLSDLHDTPGTEILLIISNTLLLSNISLKQPD